MKHIALLTLIFLTFNVCLAEEAQNKDQVPEAKKSLNFGERFLKEFSVPVTTNARYILGGSLVSAGMVYINKNKREYNKRETFKDAKPFGNFGIVGEVVGWGYLNGLYTLGHFLYGYFGNDQASLRSSEHMLKASLYTLLVTASLKTFIHTRRPGFPEDDTSFPSGHSSFSFAFASVVAARHGWAYGSLAYGMATYISVSRINDDWHYLHDVLVGMGIGAAYGWGLKYAYDEDLPYQISVIPTGKGGAISVDWSF